MKLEKSLTEESVNQKLLGVRYAVHGPLTERARQIERELQKGVRKPFARVVRANVGDCHALGQPPLTFVRHVVALAACPRLLTLPGHELVPRDVTDRVREILDDCTAGSVGAYSGGSGLGVVRRRVAEYLSRRDGGVPASAARVHLGAGASDLIKAVLAMFVQDVDGKPPAVMLPVPQYPLFSGLLTELGLRREDYLLDEARDWALPVPELERCWRRASADSCVRALVVINPGNPTGQVLSRENMEQIVRFAYERNLFLLADEVYQENVVSKPFHSFKKVMHEMGAPYSSMELASFATCSKGWAAECGVRAGFVELLGLGLRVERAWHEARALAQCPSVLGQCVLDCVMKPPAPGEPSYGQFLEERSEIQRVLCERARDAHAAFNSIPGYSCNPIEGAMFAFPRVELPPRALEAARARDITPDEFYCHLMLEETGICVVAGSGFGQKPGTYHFRTTILHARDELAHILRAIRIFHAHFLEEYS